MGEDLSRILASRLPAEALEVLGAVGEIALEASSQAYLVGGVVRDLLLKRETRDLDVVVVGDARQLAGKLGARFGAQVRLHKAFHTAVVSFADGLRLDLATARSEHYPNPGALPEVTPGEIRQDLFRRDFTVNTLAIRLTRPGYGELLDFFQGRKDLDARKIRVLHELSFQEDPTRVFRAVRLAVRLDFEISWRTTHLIRSARREDVFRKLSSRRLGREIELVLEEGHVTRSTRMLALFDLLSVIHPEIRATETTYASLERAEKTLRWYRKLGRRDVGRSWPITLGVLAMGLDAESREEMLRRLRPDREAREILGDGPDAVARVVSGLVASRPLLRSRVHEVCREHSSEILLLTMSLTEREEVRRSLVLYLSELCDVEPDIGGKDLLRAGVPEGPLVALGLRAALWAKLDGKAPDRRGQLAEALAVARSA